MSYVRLNVDDETYKQLAARAVAEKRPLPWQAEVELRRALGLPFPREETKEAACAAD